MKLFGVHFFVFDCLHVMMEVSHVQRSTGLETLQISCGCQTERVSSHSSSDLWSDFKSAVEDGISSSAGLRSVSAINGGFTEEEKPEI